LFIPLQPREKFFSTRGFILVSFQESGGKFVEWSRAWSWKDSRKEYFGREVQVPWYRDNSLARLG
jgi:hypothetical protein